MQPVRIVHLSDLHFGSSKIMSTWETIAHFINTTVCPDAILITGDVTDNATKKEFILAANGLAMLKVKNPQAGKPPYFIIPGNHDRYSWLGNQFWLPHLTPWRSKEMLFEKTFCNMQHVTPTGAGTLELESAGVSWKVRVIGLDSTRAQWFAQGAVDESSAKEASASAESAEAATSDLVIALVHHHLLPIPDVERRATKSSSSGKIGKLLGAANVTGMLNSGVLLQHLSASQVNLVLHGHEHVPHQSAFRGAAANAGTTVVLSAGSATGEYHKVGWGLDRFHFNVLELQASRDVRLLHAKFDKGEGPILTDGPLLITAKEIRRARFIRRSWHPHVAEGTDNRKKSKEDFKLPTSRLKKIVVVNTDRSAAITETCTDFLVGTDWSLTTANSSGFVEDAEVTFEWSDGHSTTYETPFVAINEGNVEVFRCGIPLHERSNTLVTRTTARWQWTGAVALTISDIEILPNSARTGLRQRNLEFVGVTIDPSDEYASAALTLILPDDYAPDPKKVKVFYTDPKNSSDFEESTELTKALEFCGPGHIELRISYPLPSIKYYIAWELPFYSPSVHGGLPTKISLNADRLLGLAKSAMEVAQDLSAVRIGLYGILEEEPETLSLLTGDAGNPPRLSLNEPRSRTRAAFWGGMHLVRRGSDPSRELLNDEATLCLFPVRATWDVGGPAAALLRVATKRTGEVNSGWDRQNMTKLDPLFEEAAVAAAVIAREALQL